CYNGNLRDSFSEMDLTDRVTDNPTSEPPVSRRSGDAQLTRALERARWSILWERLWPALAAIATAVGLFLAVSWLGVWLWLPPLARAAGVVIFALIALASLIPLGLVRLPSRFDGLRRLDRNSGVKQRPATAIQEELA